MADQQGSDGTTATAQPAEFQPQLLSELANHVKFWAFGADMGVIEGRRQGKFWPRRPHEVEISFSPGYLWPVDLAKSPIRMAKLEDAIVADHASESTVETGSMQFLGPDWPVSSNRSYSNSVYLSEEEVGRLQHAHMTSSGTRFIVPLKYADDVTSGPRRYEYLTAVYKSKDASDKESAVYVHGFHVHVNDVALDGTLTLKIIRRGKSHLPDATKAEHYQDNVVVGPDDYWLIDTDLATVLPTNYKASNGDVHLAAPLKPSMEGGLMLSFKSIRPYYARLEGPKLPRGTG